MGQWSVLSSYRNCPRTDGAEGTAEGSGGVRRMLMTEQIVTETTKRCARCWRTLPVEQFYKNSQQRDGLTCYCKECLKVQQQRSKIYRGVPSTLPEAATALSRQISDQERRRWGIIAICLRCARMMPGAEGKWLRCHWADVLRQAGEVPALISAATHKPVPLPSFGEFRCPTCAATMTAHQTEQRRWKVKCPHCGYLFLMTQSDDREYQGRLLPKWGEQPISPIEVARRVAVFGQVKAAYREVIGQSEEKMQ